MVIDDSLIDRLLLFECISFFIEGKDNLFLLREIFVMY